MPAVDHLAQADRIGPHLDHLAALDDQHIGVRDSRLARDARVQHQVPIFAMHRHEELRPDQGEHQLEVFLAAVARDVHIAQVGVDHIGAQPEKVIDDVVDQLLVTGDRRGREHHGVAGHNLKLRMLARCQARQHRARARPGCRCKRRRQAAYDVPPLSSGNRAPPWRTYCWWDKCPANRADKA